MDYLLDADFETNDIQYFFSLHGPRFEYMNRAMATSLSKRFGKEFRAIRILNAWPNKHYNQPNYIVLNKEAYNLSKKLGRHVVYLRDYEDVNVEFAHNQLILDIARKLRAKQSTVFVYPFTTAFLHLPKKTFTVLGPPPLIAQKLDNKIEQVKLFHKLNLPHNKTSIYESTANLLKNERYVIPGYISASYTSGGSESALIYSKDMLNAFLSKLRPINRKNPFMVAEIFKDIALAPNINVLVTSDKKIHPLVIADQILLGNKYLGNIYPSEASEKQLKQMNDIAKTIGDYLAKNDYIGLFGLDFLINKDGKLVVVDLNPRHQGGYAVNGLMLSVMGLSLTDLELSTLLKEKVDPETDKLLRPLGFAWSHIKVVPAEKGQKIRKVYHHSSIEEPFIKIGESFVTEFYEKGSLFIDGYIGYQVHTAKTRKQLKKKMAEARKEFDSKVLGV